MTPRTDSTLAGQDWWEPLGLQLHGVALGRGRAADVPVGSRPEPGVAAELVDVEAREAARAVLRAHPPVSFADAGAKRPLTAAELAERVREAVASAHRAAANERAAADEAQRRQGAAAVHRALTASDAAEPVTAGRWLGFTRGEATAWFWNLFQYEPHGFVHPGTQVRHEALRLLRSGGLPEVFGYPERARELADRGLTPLRYRDYRDSLGTPVYPRTL